METPEKIEIALPVFSKPVRSGEDCGKAVPVMEGREHTPKNAVLHGVITYIRQYLLRYV